MLIWILTTLLGNLKKRKGDAMMVEISDETHELILKCKKEFPRELSDDEIIKDALENYICDLHPV